MQLQDNKTLERVHKIIRRTVGIGAILFVAYLLIGFFGLRANQKTVSFLISWFSLLLLNLYLIYWGFVKNQKKEAR